MTTMFPPRTSFSLTPDLSVRRQSRDNNERDTSLALVQTKVASPATSGFGNDRSPLSPLGTNNMGFGLRQRREPKETTPQFESAGSGFSRASEQMKGPPRWSLTMSMGSETNSMVSMAPIPSDMARNEALSSGTNTTDEFWILVFGFSTSEQHEEVLAKFKGIGNVVSVKGVPVVNGSKNWVALSYDSPLTVEKAVCEKLLQLRDGCLCGVQRLSDADSRRFFAHQSVLSSVIEQAVGADGKLSRVIPNGGLFPIKGDTPETGDTSGELKETDILLTQDDNLSTKKKTACEKFMGWVYGW